MQPCSQEGSIAELHTSQEFFKMQIQEMKSDIKDIRDDLKSVMNKIDKALDSKADKTEVDKLRGIGFKVFWGMLIGLISMIAFFIKDKFF